MSAFPLQVEISYEFKINLKISICAETWHSQDIRPCPLLLLFGTEEIPLLSEFHLVLLLESRPELEFGGGVPSSESWSSNTFPGS